MDGRQAVFEVGRLRFQWGRRKAQLNVSLHRVSFEEAATVFADPLAAEFDDVEHSDSELREATIGHSNRNRLLLVSFTMRGPYVRLISAREATNDELGDYEEGRL